MYKIIITQRKENEAIFTGYECHVYSMNKDKIMLFSEVHQGNKIRLLKFKELPFDEIETMTIDGDESAFKYVSNLRMASNLMKTWR